MSHTNVLNCLPPQADGLIDRRAQRRRLAAWAAYFHPLEGGALPLQTADLQASVWWKARVPDISAGGVGLLVKRPIPPGTDLLIELASARLNCRPRALTARAIHATRQANGDWLVGCAFREPMLEKDL
ncbi:MAG: PilZ domain-containing protein [Gemmataceae bacterium]